MSEVKEIKECTDCGAKEKLFTIPRLRGEYCSDCQMENESAMMDSLDCYQDWD